MISTKLFVNNYFCTQRLFMIQLIWMCRDRAYDLVRGLEVVLDHYGGGMKRKFKVLGLSDERTDEIFFTQPPNNVQKHLVTYFREKYDKVIIYKCIPCLSLKSSRGPSYVPMECAKIRSLQKFNGKFNDAERAAFIATSLKTPDSRRKKIEDMMQATYAYDIFTQPR